MLPNILIAPKTCGDCPLSFRGTDNAPDDCCTWALNGLHRRVDLALPPPDWCPLAAIEAAAIKYADDCKTAALDTPEFHDFVRGFQIEIPHQRKRWGTEHSAGKNATDWFWLIGYLAGNALHHYSTGNMEKALHHCITTAAACANWHAAMRNKTNMRPGTSLGQEGGAA